MATYDASVKKALAASQQDLIDHKEHCSADPSRLAAVGRALGHQVRIKRNNAQYALYTVSEVRPESPDTIVRMGESGRKRLNTTNEFNATLDSQVPHPSFSDAEAEANSEFVERLEDDGTHTGTHRHCTARGRYRALHRPAGRARRVPPRMPGQSARGDARAGSAAAAPPIAGTSPRPTFTKRVSRASTRSSSAASPMRSRSMAPTPPRSSSGARRPPLSRRRSGRRSTPRSPAPASRCASRPRTRVSAATVRGTS